MVTAAETMSRAGTPGSFVRRVGMRRGGPHKVKPKTIYQLTILVAEEIFFHIFYCTFEY